MNNLFSSFIKFSEDERTTKVKRNIIASFFLKSIDILIYLLLIPLTLSYLNPYEFGIWLTLNSILLWINSFDIGLGNGLRNKLAVALAANDKHAGKVYVSTTFYALIIIIVSIFIIVSIINIYLDWYSILNVDHHSVPHLNSILFYSFLFFCLNFVFKFIGTIYLALQLPAVNNMLVVLGHLLSLLIIYLLTIYAESDLLYVAIAYTLSPVIVYLIAYPITFFRFCEYLAPSIKLFKIKYVKDLMGIGGKFFFLQVTGIILFSSSNIILSRVLGPESVTPYNIAYRLFSVVPLLFTILITPMWSAVTDAYAKGDLCWIKKSMDKVIRILLGVGILILLGVFLSKIIYYVWLGNKIEIPFNLTLLMGIYIFILVWSLSYSSFLNGIGILNMQIINTMIVALVFYPIALSLVELFDISGMVLAMIIVNISGAILNTIQFNKIIKGTAKGIWSK
jgi:O-antigen/teichoic acid export membrane protein